MLALQITNLLLVILSITSYHSAGASDNKWLQHGIVPDVIPAAPVQTASVWYNEFNKKVELGNELTPTQVRKQPALSWKAEDDKYYTVLMIDPDAPSRKNPTNAQWRHWLVGNVPQSDIDKGDVLTGYVGSGPPPRTQLHRYIFLIYKQRNRIQFEEPVVPSTTSKARSKFNAKAFAAKYHLGAPIAGNFFLAQHEG